jgi:hypothetical protein
MVFEVDLYELRFYVSCDIMRVVYEMIFIRVEWLP